ncbi:MAG: hypothetical protein V8R50_10740 [Clostridia bacterium]
MGQGLQIFRAAVDLKCSCHFSKIGITCQRGSGTALFFLQKFLRIVEDDHGFCRHFGRFFAAQLAEYIYDQGVDVQIVRQGFCHDDAFKIIFGFFC